MGCMWSRGPNQVGEERDMKKLVRWGSLAVTLLVVSCGGGSGGGTTTAGGGATTPSSGLTAVQLQTQNSAVATAAVVVVGTQ